MAVETAELLHSTNIISITLRLFLSLLCGGMIGFERARKGRPAGLRTHILVCIGATLAMMTNQYLYEEGLATDVARMGAQVISGVGFIGAGTIMVTRLHKVKGLTTAASLWASACLGLAIGCGFYSASIVGLFFIWFVNNLLFLLDVPIHSTSKISSFYVEFNDIKAIRFMISSLKQEDISISDLELIKSDKLGNASVGATFTARTKYKTNHDELAIFIESIEGIEFAEEV